MPHLFPKVGTGAPAASRLSQTTAGLVPANPPTRPAWTGSRLNTISESRNSPVTPRLNKNTPSQAYVTPGRRPQQGPTSAAGSQMGAGANILAQGMNNLSLQQQNPPPQGTWDPSTAPGPQIPASNFTAFPRAGLRTCAPSGYTINHGRSDPKKWFQNPVCVKSPYRRKDFKKGQVISVPYFCANMDENADENDIRITETTLGPVLSKRRMFVIVHIHLEGFFCLPLYSFGSRGINSKRGAREVEYIPVMDQALKATYQNESVHYEALVHVHDNPYNNLSKDTVCHLTGGVRVGWQEQILSVGRLTQDSFKQLVRHYKNVCEEAEKMPWD